MAKILGRDEQIAGRVHQTGRFRTYLLFHGGNAGIAAIGTFRSFQSCDHIACLDAQSQRNHVGERGRTFQRNRKIAGERACENRIGSMRNVIFRGRLIDAGNRRGGSGNRLSSAPQPCDRLFRIHVRSRYSRHRMPGSESGSALLHSSAITSTPSRSTSVSTRSTSSASCV